MSLRSKIIAYTDGSGVFWFLIMTIGLVILAYLYLVNQTVVLVAERKSLETKISEYRTEIAGLEAAYISEKNVITKELAQNLGYGEARKTVYIQKKSVSILTEASTVQ